MSLTFRYKSIERPRPLPPAVMPMIPAVLKARRKLDVLALLDSGADTTVFSKDIAEIIGAGLSGEREVVDGIGGQAEAVETKVTVIVERGHEKYFIRTKAKVILSENREDFPVIIGRLDFFDNFNITFKEKDRKIVLKKV